MNIQSVKKNWIWIALACTLASTAWVSSNDSPPTEALLVLSHVGSTDTRISRTTQPDASKFEQADAISADGLQRAQITSVPHDLFATDRSTLAQASAQTQAQAAVSQMPPLPFFYAGKLLEGDQYIVFLTEGERNLAVHIGDVIDQVWRIKSIHPPQIILSYLPLKMDATLDIGESN